MASELSKMAGVPLDDDIDKFSLKVYKEGE